MTGAKIGKYHTWEDWGLYLKSTKIEYPTRKEHLVSVPGLDGVVDLSEALTSGEPRYNNRLMLLEFEFVDGSYEEMITRASDISNKINGRRLKIVLDEDPRYFFEGAVQVKCDKLNSMVSALYITVDADPFKYDIQSSTDDWLWDSFNFLTGVILYTANLSINNTTVLLPGGSVNVVPIFYIKKITSTLTVIFNGRSHALKQGRNRFPQIRVGREEVSLKFNGIGILDIEYRRQSQ